MKTSRASLPVLILAATAALGGCKSEVEVVDPRLETIDAELLRATSCPDLESRLQADAIARIDREMDAYLMLADQFDRDWGSGFGWGRGGEEDMGSDGGVSESADGGGEGSSGTGDPTSGGAPNGAPPPEHSETNNQVEGVDEADIVETDGENLYVLSGNSFSVLRAWPAEELAVTQSLALEGTPLEMFVEGTKAVIFAHVEGTAIYDAAGVTPTVPYSPGYHGGGGMEDGCWEGCGPQNVLTQVMVLDLASGTPTVEREFFFEGNYLSSRRIENQVRVVLSGGAHLPGSEYPDCGANGCNSSDDWIEAVEMARFRAHERVLLTGLGDFVPTRFERKVGVVDTVATECTGYWVPTPGSSEYGLTQIEVIDLADATKPPSQTAIVGAAQTVYSSDDTMVLAGQSYDTNRFLGGSIPTATSVILGSTFLHRFAISADPAAAAPTYTGSVTVPGNIIDQFAIDERNGILRVATTVNLQDGDSWRQWSGLYTVSPEHRIIGRVEELAPDEQIFSARFVGDRGYIVTFRQVDPLFVFDLSDPSNPQMKAELKIPGFSEYMHPIEDGQYLLTIGQDGDDNGVSGNLALQIFDVRVAESPVLLHKLALDYGYSEAQYNHKAFTFWRDMLAIPLESWNDSDGSGYSTKLALFSIDVANGITEKGRIDHSELYDIDDEYSWCYPGGVRRGVFIEDFVYSVSAAGVLVHALEDLTTPVASAELPDFDVASMCNGYY